MSALARAVGLLALFLGVCALGVQLVLPAPEPGDGPAAAPETLPEIPVESLRRELRRELAEASVRPVFAQKAVAALRREQRPAEPAVAGSVPEPHTPTAFRAAVQEGGIRLSWLPNRENPVEGVRYRLTRWAGEGEAVALAELEGLEFLDHVDCEGLTYHYRLRAVLRREVLEGRWATRESPAAAAGAELPRRAQWSVTGRDPQDRLLMVLERPGRPRLGPYPAGPGDVIGDTGWFLESLSIRETTIRVATRIPRFDALGRRVIINDRPADRIREGTAERQLANVRLADPCGTFWSLDLLLPEAADAAEGD